MPGETGTRFKDWVDHLVIRGGATTVDRLASLGFERQAANYAVNAPVFAHPGGIFPRVAIMPAPPGQNGSETVAVSEIAIKVERVADFSRAHDLGLEIEGYPMGPTGWAGCAGDADDAGGRRAAGLSRVSSRFPVIWRRRDG